MCRQSTNKIVWSLFVPENRIPFHAFLMVQKIYYVFAFLQRFCCFTSLVVVPLIIVSLSVKSLTRPWQGAVSTFLWWKLSMDNFYSFVCIWQHATMGKNILNGRERGGCCQHTSFCVWYCVRFCVRFAAAWIAAIDAGIGDLSNELHYFKHLSISSVRSACFPASDGTSVGAASIFSGCITSK
jgi:hypothetical protein